MSKKEWRALLHLAATVGWVAGLIADVEDKRWGCFLAAISLHLLAESLGGNLGLELA